MPAILRCFRIAGFLFSKEGCYITQNEVNAVFDEQVRLCADTLKRKTKEYTGDDPDRLGAFKAAAALQHTTPQRALAGKMCIRDSYNTSGASHVGIYVGNGMMIHCGAPISYANINTSYWQQHFYKFGRLP